MASVEERPAKNGTIRYRVSWNLGGTRSGARQSATFDDKKMAGTAAKWVEGHGHNVTKFEVYHHFLNTPLPEATTADSAPTVAEFVDTFFASKSNLTPMGRGVYRRHFRLEIVPEIGHLQLTAVTAAHIKALLDRLGRCDCVNGVRGRICSRVRNRHGLDRASVDRYFATMSGLFKLAVGQGKVQSNPCERTGWKVGEIAYDDGEVPNDSTVYLTEDEYHIIRARMAPDAVPLLEFLINTGTRWSEATATAVGAIRPPDWDQPDPEVLIHRAWKQVPTSEISDEHPDRWYIGTTKGRKWRTIPVPPELLVTLAPLTADRPADALLFHTARGTRINPSNWVQRRWDPAITAAMRCTTHPPSPEGVPTALENLAGPRCGDNEGVRSNNKRCDAFVVQGMNRCKDHLGIPKDAVTDSPDCKCDGVLRRRPTPHDLRHTFAGWLIERGVPIAVVSQLLGHRDTETTEKIYAGKLPRGKAAAAKVIAEIVKPRDPGEQPSAGPADTPQPHEGLLVPAPA